MTTSHLSEFTDVKINSRDIKMKIKVHALAYNVSVDIFPFTNRTRFQ